MLCRSPTQCLHHHWTPTSSTSKNACGTTACSDISSALQAYQPYDQASIRACAEAFHLPFSTFHHRFFLEKTAHPHAVIFAPQLAVPSLAASAEYKPVLMWTLPCCGGHRMRGCCSTSGSLAYWKVRASVLATPGLALPKCMNQR